jgi:hypothetical protein
MENNLLFTGKGKNITVPHKKRVILGNSESADILVENAGIYSIHAVLEFVENKIIIYNLTSSGVVKVNGEQVVKKEIKLGDELVLGEATFSLSEGELPLPPVMEEGESKELPPAMEEKAKALPVMPTFDTTVNQEGMRTNYPLESDNRYTYSEYIFEDADEVFPIFKYSVDQYAVEVIILFNDKIISVDYLAKDTSEFFLSGTTGSSNSVEFPYLGKKESLQIISKKGDEFFLHKLPGFKHTALSDVDNTSEVINLNRDDIHLFENESIKIFVRGDEAPPMVKAAPILRRDPEFKKYLLLCVLFVGVLVAALNIYEVDPELEKEKAPERIAKILYKPKKLNVTKKKTFAQNKVKVKEKMKAPKKEAITKKQKDEKVVKTKGDPTKKGQKIPKKGSPKKGPTNKKTVVKATNKKAGKAGKTSNKVSKVKKRTNNKKFKGNVDTYKTTDFSSSISSLMAKGGTLSSYAAKSGSSESFTDNTALSESESAQVQKAEVAAKVGSLSGATQGSLESSFGTDGLVQKKQVYIAGVPYKEVILGSIDRNDILRILLENVPQFRYCYQKELDVKQKGIDGVVALNFVIGASGHVTRASVSSVDKNMPRSITGCIVSHLKTIQFPRPKGGGQVSVNTPLNLQSKAY